MNKKIVLVFPFLFINNLYSFSLNNMTNDVINNLNKNKVKEYKKEENKTTPQNINQDKNQGTMFSKIKHVFQHFKKIGSSVRRNSIHSIKNNKIQVKLNIKDKSKIIEKGASKEQIKDTIVKLYSIKKNIKKSFENRDFQLLFQNLDKLKNLKYLKKDIKNNFYVYSFWNTLLYYIDRPDLYIPKVKNKSYKILSKILGYMDTKYNFETKLSDNIFKLISYARMYNGDPLYSLLYTYYPYGLNDSSLFYKLFKVMNSEYISSGSFLKIYKYLKNNFINYFYSNSVVNFDLTIEYFKLLIKYSYDYDFISSKNQRLLNNLLYQNPVNSNLYYYKSLYYKYEDEYDKMENYLIKSIKYDGNNNKSWYEFIKYEMNNRQSIIKKILKHYHYKYDNINNINYFSLPKNIKDTIMRYDNKIIKQIDFYQNNTETSPKILSKILLIKGNLFFIEGTNFNLPNKLVKSAEIYFSIKKCNLIKNVYSTIRVISTNPILINNINQLLNKCKNLEN